MFHTKDIRGMYSISTVIPLNMWFYNHKFNYKNHHVPYVTTLYIIYLNELHIGVIDKFNEINQANPYSVYDYEPFKKDFHEVWINKFTFGKS